MQESGTSSPSTSPDFKKQYGTPVSFEDMLGTVMGFSLLVVNGLKQLEIGLTDEQAEDLYYPWRVFSQIVGIHPPGLPDSTEYVPANLEEAGMFYRSYARRHYAWEAVDNRDGVELAQANRQMMNDMLPQTPLRRLGLKSVPRIYMQRLVGNDGCWRVGIKPVPLLFVTKWVLLHLPAVWVWLWERLDGLPRAKHVHERLSQWIFQRIIKRGRDGRVHFVIPDDLADLRELI